MHGDRRCVPAAWLGSRGSAPVAGGLCSQYLQTHGPQHSRPLAPARQREPLRIPAGDRDLARMTGGGLCMTGQTDLLGLTGLARPLRETLLCGQAQRCCKVSWVLRPRCPGQGPARAAWASVLDGSAQLPGPTLLDTPGPTQRPQGCFFPHIHHPPLENQITTACGICSGLSRA